MENFKRSTARDFRINCATLNAALREESSEDDEKAAEVIITILILVSSMCVLRRFR